MGQEFFSVVVCAHKKYDKEGEMFSIKWNKCFLMFLSRLDDNLCEIEAVIAAEKST